MRDSVCLALSGTFLAQPLQALLACLFALMPMSARDEFTITLHVLSPYRLALHFPVINALCVRRRNTLVSFSALWWYGRQRNDLLWHVVSFLLDLSHRYGLSGQLVRAVVQKHQHTVRDIQVAPRLLVFANVVDRQQDRGCHSWILVVAVELPAIIEEM